MYWLKMLHISSSLKLVLCVLYLLAIFPPDYGENLGGKLSQITDYWVSGSQSIFYIRKRSVPRFFVGLRLISDYRGVGLSRFRCKTITSTKIIFITKTALLETIQKWLVMSNWRYSNCIMWSYQCHFVSVLS